MRPHAVTTLFRLALAGSALPQAATLPACQGGSRRARAGAGAGGGPAPAATPTDAEGNAPSDASDPGEPLAVETEAESYAGDPRFEALSVTFPERVAAAAQRLEDVLGLGFSGRAAPRVVLAPLEDDRVAWRVGTEIAGGRLRPVVSVNAEPLVSGVLDPDRTLLRALAEAALSNPHGSSARPGAGVPGWFASLAGIVAAGDLAERLEREVLAAAREGRAPSVDPDDPAKTEATALGCAILLGERSDPAGIRRLMALVADGDDPAALFPRWTKDPTGGWVGPAREALLAAAEEANPTFVRALVAADRGRREMGALGIEAPVRAATEAARSAGRDPPSWFLARADEMRLLAAVDAGDGESARAILLARPAEPSTLALGLADPGGYVLLAARTQRLPGGDPNAAWDLYGRFEADFPSHPERDAARDEVLRMAAALPPSRAAQAAQVVGRIVARRVGEGSARVDAGTTKRWARVLLADHRPGAARAFFGALAGQTSDPDLDDVHAETEAAESSPSDASREANARRVDAWLVTGSPTSAQDAVDGGLPAAEALAARLPPPSDARRAAAVRLCLRAAGLGRTAALLAPAWAKDGATFGADASVLAGEADYDALAAAIGAAFRAAATDARAAAEWERAGFGLDPAWLAAHPTVLRRLHARSYPARRAAFEAVADAGLLPSAAALIARAAKDPSPLLRRRAVEAAGEAGLASVAREGLADPSWFVRQAACAAGARAGDLESVPALLGFLRRPDPDARPRAAAAHALIRLAPTDPVVVRSLVRQLRGEDAALADDIGQRLTLLPGETVAPALLGALRLEAARADEEVDRTSLFRLFLAWRRVTGRDSGYDPSLSLAEVRAIVAALALPAGGTAGGRDAPK